VISDVTRAEINEERTASCRSACLRTGHTIEKLGRLDSSPRNISMRDPGRLIFEHCCPPYHQSGAGQYAVVIVLFDEAPVDVV
jgi:hypothetical protein